MIDKTLLSKQVASVLKYSQDYPFDIHTEQLIDQWYEAKKPYIKLLGGLIDKSSKPITITLSPEDQHTRFINFIELCEDSGWFDVNQAFEGFLKENEDGFFDNKVVVDNPQLKISKGMKLLKCFNRYFTDYWLLRQVQDTASRVIQEKKLEGYLYISVHPLDYLTISENNNKWRSCHALDGDYRAGNLNYMVDETTLVAYIAPEKQEHLKCMPEGMTWNNKRWRMLIHTNCFQSVIYFNRQYPFTTPDLLQTTWEFISDRYNSRYSFNFPRTIGFNKIFLGKDKDEEYPLDHTFLAPSSDIVIDSKDVFDYSEYEGYCDLVYSEHYLPVASWTYKADLFRWEFDKEKRNYLFHSSFDVTIGRKCKCVHCGGGYIEQTDSFLCDDCIVSEDADEGFFLVCSCCGSRIYPDDEMHQDEHGNYFCETCWENMKENEK